MSNEEEYGGLTDSELVGLARSGRDKGRGGDATAELLGRYQKAVYLWCFRYVSDHEKALDLSQDVFLRAIEGLDSFAGKSKFSSWLFSITRNRCLNEVRRVDLLGDGEGLDVEHLPGRFAGPDRELEEREGEARVLSLLNTALEPMEKKAIWLRCYERLPVDEITKLLGIETSSGARGMLQTARRKLRAVLEEG
ncbi:MAG: sigma-70 family RNA polymerase sigma factor [Candidatus Krumholzibacteriota bacterium]|nr:sigma-70 family RNA polymerase sigma factor [Candidatus Krumholzibacteriota bacterium]